MPNFATSIALAILIALLPHLNDALDNGLALTPPMGWLTWQRYRCEVDCKNYPDDCINEDLIVRTAQLMVKDGWLAKGYEYIILDDCWSAKLRDTSTHKLLPDPQRFPRGMRWLSDFVHKLGLKFGIYLDFGSHTCSGYPGSLDYLKLDAETIANWTVDYVKMDGCYSEIEIQAKGYAEFGGYLNSTNRHMVFSCSYPAYQPWDKITDFNWTELAENCNLWRMLGDIQDSWKSLTAISNSYETHRGTLIPVAGPGHWNDLDMILGGNYGLSWDQTRVQFGLWAMHASPLILSVNLAAIRPDMKEILQSDLVIRVNQDRLGNPAELLIAEPDVKVWRRRLADFDGGWAVALLYSKDGGGHPKSVVTCLRDLGIPGDQRKFKLLDAFSGIEFVTVEPTEPLEIRINPSGIVMLIVQPLI